MNWANIKLYLVEKVKQENMMENKKRIKILIETRYRATNTFSDMKEFIHNIVKEICLRGKVPVEQVWNLTASKSVGKTEEDVTGE